MTDKEPIDATSRVHQDVASQSKMSDAVYQEFLPLVESVASVISSTMSLPTGVCRDDLINYCVEGLMKTTKRFDDSKGASFKTFAFYRIRGEIVDQLRKEWALRSPSVYAKYRQKIEGRITDMTTSILSGAGTPSGSLSDMVANSAMVYLVSMKDFDQVSGEQEMADSILSGVSAKEDYRILAREVEELTQEEQPFIDLFYYQNKKQVEIAEILNLSKSKLCRMHVKLLEKLKSQLEKNQVHR